MPPRTWNVEPISDDDLAEVLELNQLYQKQLSSLTMAQLRALRDNSSYHRSIEGGKAFIIALDDRSAHDGENFRWFKQRFDSFVYIDRIAIGESLQRRGLAAALYQDLEQEARSTCRQYLCAEVGLEPPNEASLQFHDGLGFRRVGIGAAAGKTVQYFAKTI
ncbi:GNAT family N-acetyltransferase [uncultured Erythrobacter sp.]|uniref:GNAT family N-acetyltransferase n=1 Tax=uncultured Erythrobacter sp. TaxID=263913 RepID=UPI0026097A7C|nr:GNAT family N-acetyltransferase [uncultured Erythrobacter sp.]